MEHQDQGFIKLSRKFFKNPFWNEDREFSKGEAWLDLIQSARFEPSNAIVNGKVIELQRGEVAASIRYLAKRWSWGEQKVRTFIKNCVKMRMITQRQHSGETVIRLVKYGVYNNSQHSDDSESNTAITHRQHTDDTAITQSKESKEGEKSKEGKEIIEVEAVASPPVVKKEKFSIEKFTDPSNLPFTGDEFISKWEKLLQTKKWRNKSESAIEETVAKMQRFNEEFMTRQIESALVGEWQGLFFSNTESDFQKFLQGNGKTSFEKKVQGMNSTAAMALQLLNQKEFDNEHGN